MLGVRRWGLFVKRKSCTEHHWVSLNVLAQAVELICSHLSQEGSQRTKCPFLSPIFRCGSPRSTLSWLVHLPCNTGAHLRFLVFDLWPFSYQARVDHVTLLGAPLCRVVSAQFWLVFRREEKSIHHHRGVLFFLFRVWGSIVYTLLSGPMVYTLFPFFPRKRVYTIAFFALWPRGRATDREKRAAAVVVYSLFYLVPSERPRRILGETPAEPSERPPQSLLRGKFPRRAWRRVVPLGWWLSGTLEWYRGFSGRLGELCAGQCLENLLLGGPREHGNVHPCCPWAPPRHCHWSLSKISLSLDVEKGVLSGPLNRDRRYHLSDTPV